MGSRRGLSIIRPLSVAKPLYGYAVADLNTARAWLGLGAENAPYVLHILFFRRVHTLPPYRGGYA